MLEERVKIHRRATPEPPSDLGVDDHDPAQAVWSHAQRAELAGTSTYFTMSSSSEKALAFATTSLHQLFLRATAHVLGSDRLLAHFQIQEKFWPLIRHSWALHPTTICGRLDFAVGPSVKVLEYNADSASCLMECGLMQDKWAHAVRRTEGYSGGALISASLEKAWREAKIVGLLHLMHDEDIEERYHTLYMKSAAERAGIQCKVVAGLQSLRRTASGTIVDEDGTAITNVWKTWSWETALRGDQNSDLNSKLHLREILLHPDLRVLEPLWTVIPSNKAILPILWSLFSGHPLLLSADFEINDSLRKTGYASKPITGRGGSNVRLHEYCAEEVHAKEDAKSCVLQQLCKLPQHGDLFVQVNCFVIGGQWAGIVLRGDKTPIITYNSPIFPLRVLPGGEG